MKISTGEHGAVADIHSFQGHGYTHGRDFTDAGGHVWGAMWLDMSAMPSGE